MFKYICKNILKSRNKYFSQTIPIEKPLDQGIEKASLRGKNRPRYNLSVGQNISNFTLKKILRFNEFDMNGYILEHNKTGAQYYHIDSSDTNNGFAVHFTTPAFNDTGVFHILEHLSLCGSRKYPVRDPFFNMLKRSLNSYMNAWTGPDFTMYPFAAENDKDYKNLRDVYTDATFYPKLDYYDFLQEGWRYEFLDSNTKNTLLYKGVVFNEMKGAYSRQDAYFIQKLQSNLYIDSTYKYESGGSPKYILSLKYEDLVNAHKKYYHPTNTKFITYGDLDFRDNLDYLESSVLQHSERGQRIFVEKSRRLDKPREIIDFYQPEMGIGDSNVAKMAISFLCGCNNDDPYETFKL
jgi:Zn-dependent M16 (insulinase) family peptidase